MSNLDIQLHNVCDALKERHDHLLDAIVADNWPRKMANVGLNWHLETWDPDIILDTISTERQHFPDAVPIEKPILHIWPRLPGAGVTPLLYGLAFSDCEQWIKPAHSATNFASAFYEVVQPLVTAQLKLLANDARAAISDPNLGAVIVSGSDETLSAVSERLHAGVNFEGYGQRESITVIVVDDENAFDISYLTDLSARLAVDIVMWHQYGCFSSRRIVTVGASPNFVSQLATTLADAIANLERRWECSDFPADVAALRARRRNLAIALGDVYDAEWGWVSVGDESSNILHNDGVACRLDVPHVTNIEVVDRVDDVKWPPKRHFQGAALEVVPYDEVRERELRRQAKKGGATRVCSPGMLQQPPGSWRHDGRYNIGAFLMR